MNRSLVVLCALVGAMFGQASHQTPASTSLKEYSYASDGFAIKFPYAPEPHTDSIHPDFKVWTVTLNQRAAVSVRRKADSQRCHVVFDKIKSMTRDQNVPIRDFSVSGRPALEENEYPRGDMMVSERYVCGVGKYYVLTFVWPANDSRPQLGLEIMDSFRLIKAKDRVYTQDPKPY